MSDFNASRRINDNFYFTRGLPKTSYRPDPEFRASIIQDLQFLAQLTVPSIFLSMFNAFLAKYIELGEKEFVKGLYKEYGGIATMEIMGIELTTNGNKKFWSRAFVPLSIANHNNGIEGQINSKIKRFMTSYRLLGLTTTFFIEAKKYFRDEARSFRKYQKDTQELAYFKGVEQKAWSSAESSINKDKQYKAKSVFKLKVGR